MKSEILMVKVTEEMKAKLKEAAEEKGMNVSTLVRMLVVKYLKEGVL